MALSRRLSGRAEENHETSQSVWWICWPRLETDAFGMHVTIVPTFSANAVSIDRFFYHIRSSVHILVGRPPAAHPSAISFPTKTSCSNCSLNDTHALCLDRCNKLRAVIASSKTAAQSISLWISHGTVSESQVTEPKEKKRIGTVRYRLYVRATEGNETDANL